MKARHRFLRSCIALGSLLAMTSAATAFDLSRLAEDGTHCIQREACIVPGAEVDDDATIKARAKTGTGPAVGFASDRRIKSDIKEIGTLPNGLKIFSFTFLWDDKVRVGVIAQDLLDRSDTKKAVLTLSNGLLGVDYGAIGLRMATEKQWLEHGASALKSDYKPAPVRSAKLDEPIKLYNKRPAY
jgi:Chaperone of endosialidase